MPPSPRPALGFLTFPRQQRLRHPSALRRIQSFYSTTTTTTTTTTPSSETTAPSPPVVRVTDLPAPGSGHIRILELNRPQARNAISRALLASLRGEIDAVRAQYGADGEELPPARSRTTFGGAAGPNRRGVTRALIVASAVDECFCAGADLKERKGFTPEETATFLTTLRATFASLAALPIPTISAVSSLALGGGLELALSTHFRVLTSNAVVGLPETRLAIIPGAGGTYRLTRLVGASHARDLILTGRRVGAPEAYFLGIADRLVEVLPEDDSAVPIASTARRAALSEAVRLAQEICEGGPVAVRAALAAVGEDACEERENEAYKRVLNTEDRDEALAAFREKRKPAFKGR